MFAVVNRRLKERLQDDVRGLNAVEDKVHDEAGKQAAGFGAQGRERQTEQCHRRDDAQIVAVLQDVDSGKKHGDADDRPEHTERALPSRAQNSAIN